jgi:hypothetical protein
VFHSLLRAAHRLPDSKERRFNQRKTNNDHAGSHACSGLIVGVLFGICTLLLVAYPLSKRVTIQMADELAERRKNFAAQAN